MIPPERAPVLQESALPFGKAYAPQKITPCPTARKMTPCPTAQKMTPCPTAQTITPCPTAQKMTLCPTTQKMTPCPTAQKMTPCPTAQKSVTLSRYRSRNLPERLRCRPEFARRMDSFCFELIRYKYIHT